MASNNFHNVFPGNAYWSASTTDNSLQEAGSSNPPTRGLQQHPGTFLNAELFARQQQREQQFIACQWQHREQQQLQFIAARQNNEHSSIRPDQVSGSVRVPDAALLGFQQQQQQQLPAEVAAEQTQRDSFTRNSSAGTNSSKLVSQEDQCNHSVTTNNGSSSRNADQVAGPLITNERILEQLEQAIGMIPMERKKAYLESLEACQENSPSFYLQFVRRCDRNVWQAAERLIRYWEHRKEIFGADRAFLPMTLTGDGALTKEDVLQLQAGYPALLPENTKTGQKVLFFDRTQWLPQATRQSKLRCIFYVTQILADQDETTQTKGILVLIMCSLPKWRDYDSEFSRLAFMQAESILPVRAIYHLLNFPAAPVRRFMFQDLLHDVIGMVIGHGMTRVENVFVHFEREQGELLDSLLDLGLTRKGLPTVVGGTFLYTECSKWCRQQRNRDSQKRRASLTRCAAPVPGSSTAKVTTAASPRSIKASSKRQPLPADPDEKKRKARERNIVHSRNKRARRRAEQQDIQDERDELLGEQESLLAEHARLTSVLDQANQFLRNNNIK